MNTRPLMLYKQTKVLDHMIVLAEALKEDSLKKKKHLESAIYIVENLIDLSSTYELGGDLWKSYIAFILLTDTNAYSVACEKRGEIEGSINKVALNDFSLFFDLFHLDISLVDKGLDSDYLSIIQNYSPENIQNKVYNSQLSTAVAQLVESLDSRVNGKEFKDAVTKCYKEYGVGDFGFHRGFRVELDKKGNPQVLPIVSYDHIDLDDLIGYEEPKQQLIDNTNAFIQGINANNCLIFGDAGTGKSSAVRAVLNRFYSDGLRIIEIYKHQLQFLNYIIGTIRNRNYKFIVFMDDLSFEEFETDYKYLKAVIEGGLEKKPDNLLIYATSNRRHLIRENYSDRLGENEDMHISDTVQEKLSLSARFGITIFFTRPEYREFQEIVLGLAEKNGLIIPKTQLLLEADRWDLRHGGARTGRSAQQFIDYLLGQR